MLWRHLVVEKQLYILLCFVLTLKPNTTNGSIIEPP